jgi:hypothetical protein
MEETGPSIPIEAPITAWKRPLTADFQKLFKALTEGVIHGVAGKWEDISRDAVAAVSAVGLEAKPGELAWALILRALTRATFDLISANRDQLMLGTPVSDGHLAEKVEQTLRQSRMHLDKVLFDRPKELPVLDAVAGPLAEWLRGYGMHPARARSVAQRLPGYFVFALSEEWRRHADLYAPLKKAFETPFTQASEIDAAWRRYRAHLARQVDANVFDETFSLRQIYVPLRAAYPIPEKQGDVSEDLDLDRRSEHRPRYWVVDLATELDRWIRDDRSEPAIRVVRGGPGSGKSSFARMFAAHLAEDESLPVVYVPLEALALKGELATSLGDFLQRTGWLAHNPLEPSHGERRLVLIFDGLDELGEVGKEQRTNAELAQQFVDEVDRGVRLLQHGDRQLKVVITGRDVVVQANEAHFRRHPGQILHVLPYILQPDRGVEYLAPEEQLALDQRHTWWKCYGEHTGRGYLEMPTALARPDLDEMTAQPLLNYLVALAYDDDQTEGEPRNQERPRFDFSAEISLNQIYQYLLDRVYQRGYERWQHQGTRKLDRNQFACILEEIGLAVWHGDGRTATVSDIREQVEATDLAGLLGVLSEGSEDGDPAGLLEIIEKAAADTSLLTIFYFRRHGWRTKEPSFEFTHKSFGEYLAARRIVHGLQLISARMRRRPAEPVDSSGWDPRTALAAWAQLCGPAALEENLVAFLRQEVCLTDRETVARWQEGLVGLCNFVLRNGMPMEGVRERPSYFEESRRARNAEEALLVALNACARATRELSRISWPEPTSAGTWLMRLVGQRGSADWPLALAALGSMAFASQELRSANLERAHLEGADLEGANLDRANLNGATLNGATLGGATLYGANLKDAILNDAHLVGANLEEARLTGAEYTPGTDWPDGFDPQAHGAVLVD